MNNLKPSRNQKRQRDFSEGAKTVVCRFSCEMILLIDKKQNKKGDSQTFLNQIKL